MTMRCGILAVAAVFQLAVRESRNRWVTGVAYVIASLVAAERVYTQRHWTSDVVVGAMVSMSVSRRVEALLGGG